MLTTLDLLGIHGYAVMFKHEAWVECLLIHESERWLGRGRTEHEALSDAIHQACPSHLARALLEAATTRTDLLGEEDDPLATPSAALPTAQDASGDTDEIASVAPVVAAPIEVVVGATQETAPTNGVVHDEPVISEVNAPHPELVQPPATPKSPSLQQHGAIASKRACDELRELLGEMSGDEEELALCTPERQRLVLLGWISSARAVQDEHPSDIDVETLVTRIARILGGLARRWWPGSIPALQQAATPSDAGRALPAHPEPSSWAEVARLAEQAACDLEEHGDAHGLDEYGWADAAMLEPAPDNPSEMLEGVVADLEATEFRPNNALLMSLAQRLRHLRGVCDVRKWANAIGEVRRMAHQDYMPELTRALDPAFVPSRPWAAVVGASTKKPEADPHKRTLEVERMLAAVPPVGDVEALRGWLRQALPLTDTHHATIADAVRNHAETVATLTVEDFAGLGRRFHRRLRKLQETLSGQAPSSERISDPSLPTMPVVAEADSTIDPSVVQRTRGRRAVFISNRNDPDHQTRLRDVLQLSELDWTEYQPRKIDAVVEAIAHNRYDIVIAATGFLNHKVDGKLSRACRDASVPYVRANHGRVAACVRALARDLTLPS